MRSLLLLLSCLCFLFNLSASNALVNRPVINMFVTPTEESEVDSQAIYATPVTVLEKTETGWSRIQTPDSYAGWVHSADLIENKDYLLSSLLRPVNSLFAHVYRVADTATHKPLITLPFSTLVRLIQEPDATSRWLQIRLIDGTEAWIQRGDLDLNPKTKSMDEMLAFTRKFLGLPYTWGGTSSYGYDCSGYVQMLYKQMGALLPRNSGNQAESSLLVAVDRKDLIPGDLIFFGEKKITHVGIYLGNDEFIHSGVRDNFPMVMISNLNKTNYTFWSARRLKPIKYAYSISEITPAILDKMTYSWKGNNPVGLNDLSYIEMNYWGYDGCVHQGEMVVHSGLAEEIAAIFGEMFAVQFPIEKMKLIDTYHANDELSMADNNSSAFCSRLVTGSSDKWSKHSYGAAIDINPLVNPYAKIFVVLPREGEEYLDRSIKAKGQIDRYDACCQAFLSRGWGWGGDWVLSRGYVDYQHFDKDLPVN